MNEQIRYNDLERTEEEKTTVEKRVRVRWGVVIEEISILAFIALLTIHFNDGRWVWLLALLILTGEPFSEETTTTKTKDTLPGAR